MFNDVIVLGLTLIYVALSLGVPVYLKTKNKLSGYQARKLIHALAGMSVLCLPYLEKPVLAVVASGVFAASMLMARKDSNFKFLAFFYKQIKEAEENTLGYLQGPFAYAVAITFTTLFATLYPTRTSLFIAALFIMIFADTAASIIGKKYGRHKIKVFKLRQDRSIEGSLAFFLVALLCALIVYTLLPVHTYNLLLLAFLTASTATFLELISPSKWDDLLIPIGTSLVLLLLV